MGEDSTITNLSQDRPHSPARSHERPQLVMIAITDAPDEPSARHRLDDIDEVRFGRGPRTSTRSVIAGKRVLDLRVPDPRMSTDHGRMSHTAQGWVLDDPGSKNGLVVDRVVTRHAAVGDGAVIELGHTFFLLRSGIVEPDAPLDLGDAAFEMPALATLDGELAEQLQSLVRIAATDVCVLLQGETGTGKEVVARALHVLSRRPGELVAVNCGALPAALAEAELFGYRRGAFTGAVADRRGLVRSADRGTLFLDEIAELSMDQQAKFLRVLQEREVLPVGDDRPVKVDVRLCAATLRDLDALVDSGAFRTDLYARLYGFTLALPPLRERIVDLGMLIRRLLAAIAGGQPVRFTPAAMRALLAHDWPLNIRELEKVLTTAFALAADAVIDLAQLPAALREPRPHVPAASEPKGEALRARLVELLTSHRGNVVAVSRELNTRRTQIYRWLRRFKIDPNSYR